MIYRIVKKAQTICLFSVSGRYRTFVPDLKPNSINKQKTWKLN